MNVYQSASNKERRMSNDWLANNDAIANIKRLLIQTGAPLESRVARICSTIDIHSHQTCFENLLRASGRCVYGNTMTDAPLREVDQGIMLQSFLDVAEDDSIGILSLELHILIECKHRDGLAVFGFPYQSRSRRSATNPILCEFAFAPFIQSLDQEVPFLQDEPICTIGLLDNMQKTPRVSDEQLIYKAGASLYDFIRFQGAPVVEPWLDPVIQDMGLIDRFKEETNEWAFDLWHEARRWLRSHLTDEVMQEFYAQRGRRLVAPSVAIFVPIVCVDAPLYATDVDAHGDIDAITPKPYLQSAMRLPKWPSTFHHYLARSTPEALVTIVNVEHLSAFLETTVAWFSDIGTFLQSIEEHELRRAIIEQSFLQSLLDTTEHRGHNEDVWRL